MSALLALVVGLLVAGLAAPRLVAGLLTAPHDQTLRDLGETRRPVSVGTYEIARAGSSRRAALRLGDWPGAWSDLGAVRLVQAAVVGYRSRRGGALLAASMTAHRRALARHPADPYAWARLTQAQFIRDGATPALNALIGMAIRTAPFEPRLVLPRLDISFRAWPMLDNRTRATIAAQIVIAARFYPKRLAKLTKERFALPIVRAALAVDPPLRRRFEFYYRQA